LAEKREENILKLEKNDNELFEDIEDEEISLLKDKKH
jgi:hypothetical protein